MQAGLPVFGQTGGLPRTWRTMEGSIAEGDDFNGSWLNMGAHTGTHVDAPAHFLQVRVGGAGGTRSMSVPHCWWFDRLGRLIYGIYLCLSLLAFTTRPR